jgi:predicted ABC-class ATPase
LELHSQEAYFFDHARSVDASFLNKPGGRRTRTHQGRGRRSRAQERAEEGGPDEAAAFIAEAVADLTGLARRHRLDTLRFLLDMAQLEAEEHLRLRSKRNLS